LNNLKLIDMQEHFVNYNQALSLKELGFDEPCLGGWDKPGDWWWHPDSDITVDGPLKSQVFKWFREKHGIWVTFEYDDCDCVEANVCWYVGKCFTYGIGPLFLTNELNDFKTYEEAESACIDKLIEIIKEKK
jgi:hypothetical protein